MAIFDTFDGESGTLVVSRPGWVAIGNDFQPVLNGAGGVRSLATTSQASTGLTVHDTGVTSHYAEAVVGDSPGGDFVCVKTPITGVSYNNFFSLIYDSGGTPALRLRVGNSNISAYNMTVTPGTVLRLEAVMNAENTEVILSGFVNGVQRIGPVSRTENLTNTGAGFRARTTPNLESMITSFEAGSLVTADTLAPTLTTPTATALSDTTASGTISTNESNGTLYHLTTAGATATTTEVKAGASQAVTATGTQTVSITGLTASTAYYTHYLHRDAAGNDSAVSTTAQFTTAAPPVTLTTEPLKNNTGTLLANEVGATLHIYEVASGNKVATKTGQTTNASGIMTAIDGSLVAGTAYRYVVVLASGAEGLDTVTAA